MLYAKVSQEVLAESDPPPPEPDYCSVTQNDFNVEGFVHELPPPKHEHNVETEQPITFWSTHKDKIHVSYMRVHFIYSPILLSGAHN